MIESIKCEHCGARQPMIGQIVPVDGAIYLRLCIKCLAPPFSKRLTQLEVGVPKAIGQSNP